MGGSGTHGCVGVVLGQGGQGEREHNALRAPILPRPSKARERVINLPPDGYACIPGSRLLLRSGVRVAVAPPRVRTPPSLERVGARNALMLWDRECAGTRQWSTCVVEHGHTVERRGHVHAWRGVTGGVGQQMLGQAERAVKGEGLGRLSGRMHVLPLWMLVALSVLLGGDVTEGMRQTPCGS